MRRRAPYLIGATVCIHVLMKNPPEIDESWSYYGNYLQGMYQRGGDFAARPTRAQTQEGSSCPRNGNEKSARPVYATALS
jgi:hypothetical protein